MGCDYYIVTHMVVVYKEEGNDKVLHHHYEQLSKHSMHLGDMTNIYIQPNKQ